MRKILSISVLFSFIFLCNNIVVAQGDIWNKTNKKGEKEGPWRAFYENGKLRYQGQFKNGVPVDEFRYYFDDGALQSILTYEEGDFSKARAIHYYQTGEKMAEGKYLDQKKSGEWRTYAAEEILVEEASYINGQKFGDWRIFYENGKILSEVYMERDLEQGIKKEYYPDGEVKKTENYKDGYKEGDFYMYSPSSAVKVKGAFVKDVRQGDWFYYNEDGTIDKVLTYDKGKLMNPEALEDMFSSPEEYKKQVKDRLEFEDMQGPIRYE